MRHSRTRSFLPLAIALSACLGDAPTKEATESVRPEVGSENADGSGGGVAQAGAGRSGAALGGSEQQGELGLSGANSGGSAGSPSEASGGAGGAGADAGSGNAGVSNGGSSAGSAGSGVAGSAGSAGTGSTAGNTLGFFVSTPSDSGGDLGGLDGADALCETLAAGVGAGDRTWRAYLSTDGQDARDRIGEGPWENANGVIVANDIAELHTLTGSVDLFIDHEGNRISGQWAGSPTPNQHDILTGSNPDGTAADANCDGWTSNTATPGPLVGHSDGLGPGMNAAAPFNSWNSSHAPAGCSQAQLNAVGGAGRVYCFAAD